ncbi:MAG: long-chain fatty acid--CoA ligase, partial [Gammaproteobacteria bacterium]
VFLEYFKNAEATSETKTDDNWVRTGDAGYIDGEGHLRIIDRAKDVGKLTDSSMFAPKFLENKLKFFPEIKEVVTFGDGRDFVTAFVNIDLDAVGNWAERNNVSYASYQELAAHPHVYQLIQDCIEQVNQSLASDPHLSASQIKRFLILHKELDPDDGELTRTRKVRRRIINERYGDLIEALFDGRTRCFVRTEVVFEDGRRGKIEADLEIRDATVHQSTSKAA